MFFFIAGLILFSYLRWKVRGAVPIVTSLTMQSACRSILKLASPGDIALFSPACASFGQFRNFEDRCRKFKELVRKLR